MYKTLKTTLIILVILIAASLIAALFLRKEYGVARQIVVNRPKQEVFDYIKLLKNQDHYSKWSMIDPDMKKIYRGQDGTVGFVSAWESEEDEVGKGEQEIKAVKEGERVDFELRFFEPFEGVNYAFMKTETASASPQLATRVMWEFTGKMSYPANLMLLFTDFDQSIGDDLDMGLKNLKAILESPQAKIALEETERYEELDTVAP